ncbi:MAG: hypothetical protein CVU36_12585 [Betaproteobacteria bacterium HGW-Betaproteobacteria-9]|jgi:hypothetical protein|nr:MAG: hypothetical protein CVU36_12585 [Betaproteobacteria bacterium HGW-Betaproteobacteria-9]
MYLLSHKSRLFRLLQAMALCLTFAGGFIAQAHAQVRVTSSDKVIFPAGLKWERMREVEFRYTPKPAHKFESKADDQAAQLIWSDEIRKSEASTPKRNMFVLVATAQNSKDIPLTFSLIDMLDFDRCEPSSNGKDMTNMFSKCLARVAIGNLQKPHIVEFEGFCYLNLNFPETPVEKNNTQFAFDRATSTAYFRVIQYGNPVSTCNRMIKLEGI